MTAATMLNRLVGSHKINWLGFGLCLLFMVSLFANVPINPGLAFAIFTAGSVLWSWPEACGIGYVFMFFGVLMITGLFGRALDWLMVNWLHLPLEGYYHPNYDALIRTAPVTGGVLLLCGIVIYLTSRTLSTSKKTQLEARS
jgi:hypothetical protein